MRSFLIGLIALSVSSAYAGVQEGLAAKRRGDYGAAYREFVPLAEAGDVRAMTTAALLLQEGGRGLPKDYGKAMGWYLRALERGDGDAFNNIGVMYRDGLGVVKNRRVAYALFLTVHMEGLGSESTVMRANRNLRREAEELSSSEVSQALCMSEEYLRAYVLARGEEKAIPEAARSPSHQRLRDKDWWLESERAALPVCPKPAV